MFSCQGVAQVPEKGYDDIHRELHQQLEEMRIRSSEAKRFAARCCKLLRTLEEGEHHDELNVMTAMVLDYTATLQTIHEKYSDAVDGYLFALRELSTPCTLEQDDREFLERLKEGTSLTLEKHMEDYRKLLQDEVYGKLDFSVLSRKLRDIVLAYLHERMERLERLIPRDPRAA